jgi:glycosyltransferase involved in cell wall biosynthesis
MAISTEFATSKTRIDATIVAVIPCFRAETSIAGVIENIPLVVDHIVCVDDASDDRMHEKLEGLAQTESRLSIIRHEANQGVGGATISGYRKAMELGADVMVKLDSDGQMDPAHIPALIDPILSGEADYVKGNRFFDLEAVSAMPKIRLMGNFGLSFMSKAASGYWNLFDPTNGYTAIHAKIVKVLPLAKLHNRYFFESDMLFRLATIRASVLEVPMQAVYGVEKSNLSVGKTLITFPILHARNFLKRIAYNYFLRGFSAASLCLLVGLPLLLFGVVFGMTAWQASAQTGIPATAGTVMLGAMPILIGFQLLLTFLMLDVGAVPSSPVHPRIKTISVLESIPSEASKATS